MRDRCLLTFGEETGWRGFALPILQRRHGALAAALLITPIWAVWHLPYFFTVTTYRGFAPAGYVGFVFGLGCGSIVLTWLYNGTGGSILACAVWHGLYNLATGTAGSTGTIQAVTSAFIYVQAFLLSGLELRARRRGEPSILGPRGGGAAPSKRPALTTPRVRDERIHAPDARSGKSAAAHRPLVAASQAALRQPARALVHRSPQRSAPRDPGSVRPFSATISPSLPLGPRTNLGGATSAIRRR